MRETVNWFSTFARLGSEGVNLLAFQASTKKRLRRKGF